MGKGLSPYPYLFVLEQSKNEQLLHEYLQSHDREVRWQTELEYFTQTEQSVTARVTTVDGRSETIEAKYLVGCDGARSPVRTALGLTFEGSTFDRLFYVVDAQIDWEFGHDAGYACRSQASGTPFFPMVGENIKNEGLRILTLGTSVTALGGNVRPICPYGIRIFLLNLRRNLGF